MIEVKDPLGLHEYDARVVGFLSEFLAQPQLREGYHFRSAEALSAMEAGVREAQAKLKHIKQQNWSPQEIEVATKKIADHWQELLAAYPEGYAGGLLGLEKGQKMPKTRRE